MKKYFIILFFSVSVFLCGNRCSTVHAQSLRDDAIQIAINEIGYHEKSSMDNLYDHEANSGSNNYTKYAQDVCVANGQPWGAVFFWWVMMQAGVPREAYPNLTTATTDWFRERGLWHDRADYTPQPGDYAVLGNVANCGIVEKVTEDSVTIIAGNRGETDSVTRSVISLDDTIIKGYGNIDYDYVFQPRGIDLGENYCAVISRANPVKPLRNYDGKPVVWTELSRADYRWLFKKQDDGTYVIQSLYDGKVLEVKDSGAARNVQIIMGTIRETDNDNQKWYISEFGVGYRLIPKNATNFCISIYGDYSIDGAHMILWQHHDGEAELFTFSKIDYIGLTRITIDSGYSKTMKVNTSQILEYKLTPEKASADMVFWVSSDNSVAEVSEAGIVKAKKEGMVTILCKSTYDSTILDKVIIEVKSDKQEESSEEEQPLVEDSETTSESTTEKQESPIEKTKKTIQKGTKIEGKECRFEITNVKNKTVKVTGATKRKAVNITIPNTVKYRGKTYKVTSVAKNAFKKNSYIKTVNIGNNVKVIGSNAFSGCKKLKKVTMGKNVTTIETKAFYECKQLKYIRIESYKLKKVGSKAFLKINKKPEIWAPKNKMEKYKKLFKGKI